MGDLSTNFSRDEFACSCGCGRGTNDGDISPSLIVNLEKVRADVGRPLFITSGCRCKDHNRAVGGKHNSVHTHLPLEVVDARVYPGPHEHAMHKAAYAHGAQGVGTANTFIHMDWHDGSILLRPAVWSY